MDRKGISPLIAAVLLIAFTMAVASIFAQWAPQLIKNAQGDTRDDANEIQSCSSILINIPNGNETHATLSQTGGTEAIGNVTLTWFYDSSNPVQTNVEINNTRGTAQKTNGKSGSYGTLDYIRATPKDCKGSSTAEYSP